MSTGESSGAEVVGTTGLQPPPSMESEVAEKPSILRSAGRRAPKVLLRPTEGITPEPRVLRQYGWIPSLTCLVLAGLIVWILLRLVGVIPSSPSFGILSLGLGAELATAALGSWLVVLALTLPRGAVGTQQRSGGDSPNRLSALEWLVAGLSYKTLQRDLKSLTGERWESIRDDVRSAFGPEVPAERSALFELLQSFSPDRVREVVEVESPQSKGWTNLARVVEQSLDLFKEKETELKDLSDPSAGNLGPDTFNKDFKDLETLAASIHRIVTVDLKLQTGRWVCGLGFFILFLWALNGILLVGLLGFQEFEPWIYPPAYLSAGLLLFFVGKPAVSYFLHRTPTLRSSHISAANLTINLLSTLLFLIVTIIFLYHAVAIIPSSAGSAVSTALSTVWSDPLQRLLAILVASALALLLVEDGISYLLEVSAHGLGLDFDKAFIRFAGTTIRVYVIILISAVLVLSFRVELFGSASPDIIILTYVFVTSLVTGVMGYASRVPLENFFAGIMMGVNPPFAKGDRIRLDGGTVYTVKEMGMRSVKLYDTQLNAEVFVPNKEMSGKTVTNISKPDFELRVQIPIDIPRDDSEDFVEHAELVMLDEAYLSADIDQAWIEREEASEGTVVTRSDVPKAPGGKQDALQTVWAGRHRTPLKDLLERLERDYPAVRTLVVPSGRAGQNKGEMFQDIATTARAAAIAARKDYRAAADADDSIGRLKAIKAGQEPFNRLYNCVLTVAEKYPAVRDKTDVIISEMSKEPSVESVMKGSAVSLILNVYVFHLERSAHVNNEVNKRILKRLSEERPVGIDLAIT